MSKTNKAKGSTAGAGVEVIRARRLVATFFVKGEEIAIVLGDTQEQVLARGYSLLHGAELTSSQRVDLMRALIVLETER